MLLCQKLKHKRARKASKSKCSRSEYSRKEKLLLVNFQELKIVKNHDFLWLKTIKGNAFVPKDYLEMISQGIKVQTQHV